MLGAIPPIFILALAGVTFYPLASGSLSLIARPPHCAGKEGNFFSWKIRDSLGACLPNISPKRSAEAERLEAKRKARKARAVIPGKNGVGEAAWGGA